jgi:hypothetical protein
VQLKLSNLVTLLVSCKYLIGRRLGAISLKGAHFGNAGRGYFKGNTGGKYLRKSCAPFEILTFSFFAPQLWP